MTIINEERNNPELKESIRMMKSRRSDDEKINLIEEGKKLDIDEVIKRNEIINNSLKYQILYNLILLFKVLKNIENTNPKVSKTSSKKSRFIKKQGVSGILSNLGLKMPLSKTPL